MPRRMATVRRLAAAETACLRARDLTQKLMALAFGDSPINAARQAALPILQELASQIADDDGTLVKVAAGKDLWPVEIDADQIRQAMAKTITNAREAMPKGGLILIDLQNVALEEDDVPAGLPGAAGQYLEITITDHGKGIPPEHLDKVLDPYFSTKERGAQKGMGLGLTTAYSIVKRRHGYLTVESEPKMGTTVRILLPAAKGEAAQDD